MQKLSNVLIDCLLRWGYADERYREIYQYNVGNRLSAAAVFLGIMALGFVLRVPAAALTYYLFFTSLRRNTGGIHAPTANICMVLSIGSFLVALLPVLVLAGHDSCVTRLAALAVSVLLSGGVVFAFAPVNHPDLDLEAWEVKAYRRKSILAWAVETAALALMVALKMPATVVFTGAVAMVAVSLSIISAKLIKQEVSNEKENERS